MLPGVEILPDEQGICPCAPHRHRRLEDASSDSGETWEIVYTSVVLLLMFAALMSDRIGADSCMLMALAAFMAAEVITIKEGLAGFSNEGVMTVIVLFVVAEGIAKTGALDWYMGKLLGRPKTLESAQLRLMIPVAVVSAFFNNTPIVVIMIPIVQRWARNARLPIQQLLIPLSFATILGGTCTLIGTSTNLVVTGLLDERYPGDPDVSIGLFDVGVYGVPYAIAGLTYILLFSPFLLPGGRRSKKADGGGTMQSQEEILLGARLTQWSPAAGRTVQRSGLRETGGIFLVSVHRAATGNVHRAVSRDFVLNVGDILYFTGLVESFGEFCEEHGLEVVTNEVEVPEGTAHEEGAGITETVPLKSALKKDDMNGQPSEGDAGKLSTKAENRDIDIPVQVGFTKESLLEADDEERLRNIYRMTDLIRGDKTVKIDLANEPMRAYDPVKIVVTIDGDLVVVGINACDRPSLLLDLSKGLLRLRLELRYTEAAVVGERSISIWRCEVKGTDLPDLEEIWSVLNALLSAEGGIEAVKKRGLRVLRAKVLPGSRLVGKTAAEVDFRKSYKAAIVAVQSAKHRDAQSLSSIRLNAGDVLVLQASDDSPLLVAPPEDFFQKMGSEKDVKESALSRSTSFVKMVTRIGKSASATDIHLNSAGEIEAVANDAKHGDDEGGVDVEIASNFHEAHKLEDMERLEMENVWRDLQVVQPSAANGGAKIREFLTAVIVAPHSKMAGKSASQVGITKLPELFLVSIDRPLPSRKDEDDQKQNKVVHGIHQMNEVLAVSERSDVLGSVQTDNHLVATAITQDDPLQEGDILWFSGPASAIGDLRKIPGLASYESDEVQKINEKVFDRRLVQAVVARKGELVGKTVKDLRFRSRFGAAVIAVHRDGKRVHEHPGKVKLQAGDVLLLEAGPSFYAKSAEHDRSFALLAEVENSAPPRLSLLIPALAIAAAMLAVFAADLTSLLISALLAAIVMVFLGIMSEQEARSAVNWDIYVTISSAFGIGTALVNSGVAEALADFLVNIGTAIGIGDAGLYGSVYFATFLISGIVTNNAAAALLFPIAMDVAEKTGTDRVLMSFVLMLGASDFITPFGYTTNLLVYGPGGYKTNDYLRFGTPMQIILWILATAYISVIRPWYVSWVGTSIVAAIVVAARMSFISSRASATN